MYGKMDGCNQFFSKWDHLFSEENDEKRALRKLQLSLHPDKHPHEAELYTKEFTQLGSCTGELKNYIRSRPPSPMNSPHVGSVSQRSVRARSPRPRAYYENLDRMTREEEEQRQAERIRQRRLEKARLEEEVRILREKDEAERREHAARGRRLAEKLEVERRKIAEQLAEQRRRGEEEERLFQQRRSRYAEEEDEQKERKRRVMEEKMLEKKRAERVDRELDLMIQRFNAENRERKEAPWCGRFCSFGKKYEYEGTKKVILGRKKF
jgi:hypothetical protein